MIRTDNSEFLLFIEPRIKENYSKEPINDEWTSLMEDAMKKAKLGGANYTSVGEPANFQEGNAWRGIHRCSCGQSGGNKEYLLENGMITNYLAVHYLQHHRKDIPDRDWKMLQELKDFYIPKNESSKTIISCSEYIKENKELK